MNKNMILFTSMWGSLPTFRMMPSTIDCPYAEVIFDPSSGSLIVLSSTKKSTYQMVPRLDDNGEPMIDKRGRPNPDGTPFYKLERRLMEIFTEHYLLHPDEIESFVKRFAENADTFPFKTFLEVSKEAKSEQSKILVES